MNNNNFTIQENIDILSKKKIKLYRDIFGEAPWNEGFICSNCGKSLPKSFYGKCECGEVNKFEPFYRYENLKNDFGKQAKNLGYRELIASILGEEIGFIWGWNTNLNKLNEDKFGLNDENLSQLIESLLAIYPSFDLENFYYFSEIGVKIEYRGQGIAGELYKRNLENLVNSGNKNVLVRTTRKTDMPYKWFLQLGFKPIFIYNDENDRVILAFNIG